MSIKFFTPRYADNDLDRKELEREFNSFESKVESIGKVYVSPYPGFKGATKILLWCHYGSKSANIHDEEDSNMSRYGKARDILDIKERRSNNEREEA